MLVAVAAILAIQLLSLTIDSLKRYRMLSKIGCDTRMLSRSLFAQITIYFLLPLLVGVCHSAWTNASVLAAVGGLCARFRRFNHFSGLYRVKARLHSRLLRVLRGNRRFALGRAGTA